MHARHGLRTRLVSIWALLAVFAVPGIPVPVAAGSFEAGTMVAYLGAKRIALSETADLHCHDRDYPVVRCFLTAEERASEELAAAAVPAGVDLLNPYVRWYRDANFTGPSYEAYYAVPDLASIGWDNMISSFSPLNGGHPLWWSGPHESGTKWDWGTAAIANLGSANDQFSSVAKP